LRSIPEPHAFSTVVFYGLKIFACKTAQFSVTQRECRMAEAPSVSDTVQRSEKPRNSLVLNWKSAALSGEAAAQK
jgi:hypothetical protein